MCMDNEMIKKADKKMKKKINGIAIDILFDYGWKYLTIVNDSIFIYNKDSGVYDIFPNDVAQRKEYLKIAFEKLIRKEVWRNYRKCLKKCIKESNENDYDPIQNSISQIRLDKDDYIEDITKYKRTVLKIIEKKLLINKNFYCDYDANSSTREFIPIYKKTFIGDSRNQKDIVDIGDLQSKMRAFFFLNIRLNGERIIFRKDIDAFLKISQIKENDYNDFKEILYLMDNSNRLINQGVRFARDLFIENRCPTNKLYVIKYNDKRILDLFLKPYLSLFPDKYISYYDINNTTFTKSMVKEIFSKRINVTQIINKNFSESQINFLNNVLNKDIFTIKDLNIHKVPVFIITYKNNELNKIKEYLKKSNKVAYIELPDEVPKCLLEPDIVEHFERNNLDVLKLCFYQNSERGDKPFLSTEEKWFKEYVEITGNKDDEILSEDFYNEYCNFCKYYDEKPKGKADFGKWLRQVEGFCEITSIVTWTNYQEENSNKDKNFKSFIKNRNSDQKYRYLGLRWKRQQQ